MGTGGVGPNGGRKRNKKKKAAAPATTSTTTSTSKLSSLSSSSSAGAPTYNPRDYEDASFPEYNPADFGDAVASTSEDGINTSADLEDNLLSMGFPIDEIRQAIRVCGDGPGGLDACLAFLL